MSGCGCGAAQAAARKQLDNGSVEGTVKVLSDVLNPYSVLGPKPASSPATKVDTVGYSTGVFVQTGKKVNNGG